MPTKRNRSGKQQNYIEAGHGDASGEYGDNATGSNKHIQFTEFKKPKENVSTESKADETPISDEARKIQEIAPKLAKNDEAVKELNQASQKENVYIKYKNKQITMMSKEDFDNRDYRSYLDMMSYIQLSNITKWNDEQKRKFVELSTNDINLCLDLPSYTSEKDYLSLLPDNPEGKGRLMRKFYFGGYQTQDSAIHQKIFTELYGKELNEISKNVTDKINVKRAELGKKYIADNFKKVNDGYSLEDALSKTNPSYYGVYDEKYRINCQRCSFTYELLRRGYDVTAKPNEDNFGANRKWTSQMCWKEQYNITGATYKSAKKQIDDIVTKAGDGARFCLGIQWKGASGHCFIAENVKGQVRYLDAQSNNLDASNYFERIQSKSPIFVGRMDNADFSASVEYTAKGV